MIATASSVASLRVMLDQSVASLAGRGEVSRADALDSWKDFYEPVFIAREIWLATSSAEDKARFDAASAEYRSRFDCACTPRGVCRCTFDDRADRSRTDSHSPDYLAGAEYPRQHSAQGNAPMSNQDPSYQMRRRAAVDRFRPVDRDPTPQEQARMDAEGAEFDRREQSVRQLKANRGTVVRTDFVTSVAPKPDDLDKALERARKRSNHRAANAWREPLNKEDQMAADHHRRLRDEDEAGFDGDAA